MITKAIPCRSAAQKNNDQLHAGSAGPSELLLDLFVSTAFSGHAAPAIINRQMIFGHDQMASE